MNSTHSDSGSMSLGSGLRRARELCRLSLREVELATGISNPYLSQLENDKIKKPSPHFLHKLAAAYGIGYEVLMEAAGYVQRVKSSGQPKTLAGAALFSKGLTAEEEEKMAEYLAFLRVKSRKSHDAPPSVAPGC